MNSYKLLDRDMRIDNHILHIKVDSHIVDIDKLLNFVPEDTWHIVIILQFFDVPYFGFW